MSRNSASFRKTKKTGYRKVFNSGSLVRLPSILNQDAPVNTLESFGFSIEDNNGNSRQNRKRPSMLDNSNHNHNHNGNTNIHGTSPNRNGSRNGASNHEIGNRNGNSIDGNNENNNEKNVRPAKRRRISDFDNKRSMNNIGNKENANDTNSDYGNHSNGRCKDNSVASRETGLIDLAHGSKNGSMLNGKNKSSVANNGNSGWNPDGNRRRSRRTKNSDNKNNSSYINNSNKSKSGKKDVINLTDNYSSSQSGHRSHRSPRSQSKRSKKNNFNRKKHEIVQNADGLVDIFVPNNNGDSNKNKRKITNENENNNERKKRNLKNNGKSKSKSESQSLSSDSQIHNIGVIPFRNKKSGKKQKATDIQIGTHFDNDNENENKNKNENDGGSDDTANEMRLFSSTRDNKHGNDNNNNNKARTLLKRNACSKRIIEQSDKQPAPSLFSNSAKKYGISNRQFDDLCEAPVSQWSDSLFSNSKREGKAGQKANMDRNGNSVLYRHRMGTQAPRHVNRESSLNSIPLTISAINAVTGTKQNGNSGHERHGGSRMTSGNNNNNNNNKSGITFEENNLQDERLEMWQEHIGFSNESRNSSSKKRNRNGKKGNNNNNNNHRENESGNQRRRRNNAKSAIKHTFGRSGSRLSSSLHTPHWVPQSLHHLLHNSENNSKNSIDNSTIILDEDDDDDDSDIVGFGASDDNADDGFISKKKRKKDHRVANGGILNKNESSVIKTCNISKQQYAKLLSEKSKLGDKTKEELLDYKESHGHFAKRNEMDIVDITSSIEDDERNEKKEIVDLINDSSDNDNDNNNDKDIASTRHEKSKMNDNNNGNANWTMFSKMRNKVNDVLSILFDGNFTNRLRICSESEEQAKEKERKEALAKEMEEEEETHRELEDIISNMDKAISSSQQLRLTNAKKLKEMDRHRALEMKEKDKERKLNWADAQRNRNLLKRKTKIENESTPISIMDSDENGNGNVNGNEEYESNGDFDASNDGLYGRFDNEFEERRARNGSSSSNSNRRRRRRRRRRERSQSERRKRTQSNAIFGGTIEDDDDDDDDDDEDDVHDNENENENENESDSDSDIEIISKPAPKRKEFITSKKKEQKKKKKKRKCDWNSSVMTLSSDSSSDDNDNDNNNNNNNMNKNGNRMEEEEEEEDYDIDLASQKARAPISLKNRQDFKTYLRSLKFDAIDNNEMKSLKWQLNEFYQCDESESQHVLSKHSTSNSEIKIHDIKTLAPGTWLNDEVINYYMALLQERNNVRLKDGIIAKFYQNDVSSTNSNSNHNSNSNNNDNNDNNGKPIWCKCVFMNSYFYSKMNERTRTSHQTQYKYANVKRWTTKNRLLNVRHCENVSSIFDCDKMIFPINHHNTHWTLGCINIKNERIEYYDSMGGNSIAFNEMMKEYIQDEWNDKIGKNKENSNFDNKHGIKKLDISKWQCANLGGSVPQQNNSYDCGVFTCKFADWICDDMIPDFSQHDIPYFRNRISAELLAAKMFDVHLK